ncbi:aminotransferase class V-fold PLP-dependent enzyme [Silvanigrella sp.]|jgi:kynureninase|uniref:aminotransferase class V-fold PLP-dependent enzyme n=1 Tax=Silvanigrella sp. TaxID=2024976 RepID=UPI0037C9F1D2
MDHNLISNFIKPDGIYFLNHSVGCLSYEQELVKNEYFNSWKKKGGFAWEDWLPSISKYHEALSLLLNGKANEFCYQNNISTGFIKILSSLPKRKKRKKILISDLEFPSIILILKKFIQNDYEIKIIKSNNGKVPFEHWEKELDINTHIAVISHTTYSTSYKNSIHQIADKCRELDIFCVIDIAQSVGMIPIDLKNLNCDFIMGSCIKWVCGGSGAGFIWINEKRIEDLTNNSCGWFSLENIFTEDINDFKFINSASKFLDGTPNILPMILATESIRKIIKIGIEEIYNINQKYIDSLISFIVHIKNINVISPIEPNQRGGTLVIKSNNDKNLLDYLLKNNVYVDRKENYGIRISPHIYNTWDEMEEFKKLLSSYRD